MANNLKRNTMNNIQIFQNNQFGQIRVATTESGEPLFAATDICQILGYSNPSKAVADHTEPDERYNESLERGGSMTFITESGLYSLILRSNKSEAKVIKKWVTSEVLPSVRQHGGYLTPDKLQEVLTNPDTIIRLATQLKDEQAKRAAAEKREAALIPKAKFLDKVFDAGEKIDIGQAAKILGLPYGRNTLFRKLREEGIFFKNRNEPKQEYVERRYFELREQWIDRTNHDGFVVLKVLVTQKGLAYLNKILSGNHDSGYKLPATRLL